MKKLFDYIIIGGGLIGLAIGYGLSKLGRKCLILDEKDNSFKAARGNFGLIWVQGKGAGVSRYADWTMRSSELWSNFSLELEEITGIKLNMEQNGGIHVCLTQKEFDEREKKLNLLRSHQNGKFDFQMLNNDELSKIIPGLGIKVFGGSFSYHDGHVNPLYLMKSLHNAFIINNGKFISSSEVIKIKKIENDFIIQTKKDSYFSKKLVLAAGLGNKRLAPMIGLSQPVKPIKGHILITEKIKQCIPIPTTVLRQTKEGSIMIGDSHEDLGMDISSDPKVISKITKRAINTFPELANKQIIRSWAALRVMSPDGLPIYDQSSKYPGGFAISCHSGVTLAAAHSNYLASYIDEGLLGNELRSFSEDRFNVPKN